MKTVCFHDHYCGYEILDSSDYHAVTYDNLEHISPLLKSNLSNALKIIVLR